MRTVRGFAAFVAALMVYAWSTAAVAADVTIPLVYSTSDGYSATGSVTFNDAIWVPNASNPSLTDMTSFSLTVTGPLLPTGHTFTKADLVDWYFSTNASNKVTDLNFFMDTNVPGCAINGVEVFLLGIFCNDTQVATLLLQNYVAAPPQPVPALALPGVAMLAALMLLAAAFALRRRGPARDRIG
ncbi:MAG: hypothetical protein JSR18_05865 [Proteobacteria bacterium]|nr:hypothetical protein [Pseudomonadota bacterium]